MIVYLKYKRRRIRWGCVGFWLAYLLCIFYLVWILVNAFIGWNWPA
jgi:hypothetical protein